MRSDVRASVESVALVALSAVLAAGVEATEPVDGSFYAAYRDRPSVLLKGTWRDFDAADAGGHPDFGHMADGGAGRYIEIFRDDLTADGKPRFASTGRKVISYWLDGSGNAIMPPRSYIEAYPDDVAGDAEGTPNRAITTFGVSPWFRDDPMWNTSVPAPLTLNRVGDKYIFDGSLDSVSGSEDHDYTYEIDTMFVYEAGDGWYIEAESDAEVWVYVDEQLVIDGGGGFGTVMTGGDVLLVVGDAASPSVEDQARRDLLESWGYSVSLIDDGAAQSEVDATAALHSVVYISEQCSSASVGSKYKAVPIGVVNESPDLSDIEMGFSTSKRLWLGQDIVITDNTHPITTGYPLGALSITTASWTLHRADGGLSLDATGLARLPNHPNGALSVLDTGERMYGGVTTPARRVRLPWGGNADFGTLNTDGLAILQRSLVWASNGVLSAPSGAGSGAGSGSGGGGGGTPGFSGHGVRVNESMDLSKIIIDGFNSNDGEYGVDGNSGVSVEISTNSTAPGAISLSSGTAVIGDVYVGPGGNPSSVIDAGGGTYSGTAAALSEPFEMPTIEVPTDAVVGPNVGSIEYADDPFTISANMHVDNLRIKSNAVVTIDGNVTILVEGGFKCETGGQILVTPGSSLDLYCLGSVEIKTKSSWSDPSNSRIWIVGDQTIKLETEAAFHGSMIAPDSLLQLKTKAKLFGSYFGRGIAAETESSIHVDFGAALVVDGTAGTSDPGDPVEAVPGVFAVEGKLSTGDPGTVFDGWDSSDGPYGGSNAGMNVVISSNGTTSNIVSMADTTVAGSVLCGPGADVGTTMKIAGCTLSGTTGTLDAPVPIPSFSAPALGPTVGDINVVGGSYVLNMNVHCGKFAVDGGGLLEIDGNVTIYCEGEFNVSASEVRLRPGATLDVYVVQDFKLENGAIFNATTADPTVARVYKLAPGSQDVKIDGGSVCYANIAGQEATLTMNNASHLYGTFLGAEASIEGGSGVHIDLVGLASPPSGGGDDTGDVAQLPTELKQRVSMDRLNWLADGRTYDLKIFVANRFGQPAGFRLETNIPTLRLASPGFSTAGD